MSATTETVTMDQWRDHVLTNCNDSYSLVHCVAAMYLAEYGAEDESDWDAKMSEAFPVLTGFQAGCATSIARQIWPLFEDARKQSVETKDNFAKFLRQAAEDGTLIVIGDDNTP